MLNILKVAFFAMLFLPSGTGLALAHGTHGHTGHNQHLVSIVQPDKIYKDGDPVIVEFEARNLLSGVDVGPYTGELKIFLKAEFHTVSESFGDDISLGYQGNSCFDDPRHLVVEFDGHGRSVFNDSMQIFTINDTAEFGRIDLNNSNVVYSGRKLSHIETELITGCSSDMDSYIVSAQKYANYLTENSLIGEFNSVSKETADNIGDTLEAAFSDNDDHFNFDLDLRGKEKIALNADFAYKFSDVAILWGTGDIADLDGTLGFNYRAGENSLIGLAGSLNSESLSFGNGEYNTEVTTMNPFLFFKSEDWSSQLLLMAGYGTGDVYAKIGRLHYHDRGELYVMHLNGMTDIYGPISIIGEGWYANHHLFKSSSSVTINNTRLSLQFGSENIKTYVSVEHDLYADFVTVVGSNAKIGNYSPHMEWNIFQNEVEGGVSVQVNENLAFDASANSMPIVNLGGTLNW